MKLRVENIGKVRLGLIDLDGLTVVAGPNSAGKSTIGRCLVTYSNLCRQMDVLVRNRKIKKFGSRLVEILKLSDNTQRYLGRYMRNAMEPDAILAEESWNTSEKIKKILLGAAKRSREEPPSFGQTEDSEIDVNAVISALRQVVSTPTSEYMSEIVGLRFRRAFKRQINPLADSGAVGSVSVFEEDGEESAYRISFAANKVTAIPSRINYQLPPVIYLEPIHILDVCKGDFDIVISSEVAARYGGNAFDVESLMENHDYDVDYADTDEKECVARLVMELIGIIKGGLEEVDDEMLRFKEWYSDTASSFVELENLASGAKSMSVVIHALRNGTLRRGTVLAIDEPESNLHPEWQVKFAHALVMLHKRLSVKVLLNTHSPYFLKAIEFYAEQEDVLGAAHFYLMEQVDGDVLYTAQDCTGDTHRIFDTMYQPFTAIM